MKKKISDLVKRVVRQGTMCSMVLLAAPTTNTCGGGGTTSPDTVLAGDSYVNWVSHDFPAKMNAVAGVTFPNYAVGGASMATGGIAKIPPQLDQAIAANPNLKNIIMTGGGNDILICDTALFPGCDNCKNDANAATNPVCQAVIHAAIDGATTLMQRAAQVGIKDVVYFFYPRVPDGTLVGGAHPNVILGYALPRAKALCDQAVTLSGLRCHFVDMSPVFEGHPEYFFPGDIHPNNDGATAMANAVWAKMKADCVAQNTTTCTPHL